jgi:hypothetical protein
MHRIDALVILLVKALREPKTRDATVKEFQEIVRESRHSLMRPEVYDVFADLAYDFDYFVSDPIVRGEDPSYYGNERLQEEIETALRRLTELGIEVLQYPSIRCVDT